MILDIVQYSQEWVDEHIARVTSSEFCKIVNPKCEPVDTDKRRNFLFEKAGEAYSKHRAEERYVSWEMKEGIRKEPIAADDYAERFGVTLDRIGFVITRDGKLGASPDRIIRGREGELVEIKCPTMGVHMRYLNAAAEGRLAALEEHKDYFQQVQGQLLVGAEDGFKRVHWYSWHPFLPPVHQTIERNVRYMQKMEGHLRKFLADMEVITNRVHKATFEERMTC